MFYLSQLNFAALIWPTITAVRYLCQISFHRRLKQQSSVVWLETNPQPQNWMYSALLKIWGRHICSLSQLFLLGFTQEDGSPFRSNGLWQYGQSMTLYAWRQLQSFHACEFHKNHFCSLRWIITFQNGEGCLHPWDHHQVTLRLSALTKAFCEVISN